MRQGSNSLPLRPSREAPVQSSVPDARSAASDLNGVLGAKGVVTVASRYQTKVSNDAG